MKRVTAEEARGLLEGATPGAMSAAPDADDAGTIWCVRDDRGVRLALLGVNDGADARLFAAAPDLASTVVALEADLAALRIEREAHAALLSLARRDRDEARAERDRLRDILAAKATP